MRTARQRLAALALAGCALACGGRLERAAPSDSSPAVGAGAGVAAESEVTGDDPVDGAFSSEAERTRAMEAQAADLKQHYDEAMAGAASEEEKIRAYQEFEQGRQELNEMSESDLGEGDDAYAPPPES